MGNLVKNLAELETSPWGEFNHGKPLSKTGLAKLLHRFEIEPRTIRIDDDTIKGYLRAWFDDAFSRYLSSPLDSPVSETSQASQANVYAGETRVFEAEHEASVTVEKSEVSPVFTRVVTDVTVGTSGKPKLPEKSADPVRTLPSCNACGSYALYRGKCMTCEEF